MGAKAIKVKFMQAKLSSTFHQHLLNTYYVPSPLCRVRNLAVNEKDKIPATQQEIDKRLDTSMC